MQPAHRPKTQHIGQLRVFFMQTLHHSMPRARIKWIKCRASAVTKGKICIYQVPDKEHATRDPSLVSYCTMP